MKLTDVLIFVVGLVIMVYGLSRLSPTSFASKKAIIGVLVQAAPLFIVLLVLLVFTYRAGGSTYITKGLTGTFKVTASFLPTIMMLFPVMAIGGVLAMHHKEAMENMLLGKYGYPGTLGAAFLVPTSNTMAEPIKVLWENPLIRPTILYFLTAAALVCWPIFFFRALGLTLDIAWQMYKTNWIVALCMLPPFWLWTRAVSMGGWGKAIGSLVN